MYPLDNQTIKRLTDALEGLEEFIFFETCRFSAEEHTSYLLTQPRCWLRCTGSDDAGAFLDRLEEFRGQGYFLAGWFAYEFGYQLESSLQSCAWPGGNEDTKALIGVFETPLAFDHATGRFSGGQGWPQDCKGEEKSCVVGDVRTTLSRKAFIEGVGRIKEAILAGETYQVNYTFPLHFSFSGSVAALYRQLRLNQSVAYGAWIRHGGQDIISFSPELFFAAGSNGFRVRPMKGTLGRGRTLGEDRQQGAFLAADGKSRSENVMIVDLLRNDLARLLYESGGGAVRVRSLFDVERYESLLQLTSTIEGILGKDPELKKIMGALFPCGSVTGAPKVKTMELIRQLEKEPRGVYCGAIGFCHKEKMTFNVPIRTLTLERGSGQGRMGVGAGIVQDSDPEAEWDECLLKGRFLTHPQADFQLLETLCYQPGSGYLYLAEHLERLLSSAEYFFFQAERERIENRLQEVAQSAGGGGTKKLRVRLVLHKDGRIETEATPLLPLSTTEAGLPPVAFSAHRIDPEDRFLYHKTTCRELYGKARKWAESQGLYEIFFVNIRAEVTEGTISTLFMEKNGQLYTPALSSGLLPGTLRRALLESGQAEERILTMEDIMGADALFMGNSVRGLVAVRLVEAVSGLEEKNLKDDGE